MTHDKPVSMIAPCAADFMHCPVTEERNRGAAVNISLAGQWSFAAPFLSVCFHFIILVFRARPCGKPAVSLFLRIAGTIFSLAAVPRLA